VRLRIEQRNKKLPRPRLLTSGWAIDSVEDPSESGHPVVNGGSGPLLRADLVHRDAQHSVQPVVRGPDTVEVTLTLLHFD